jgi:hypothetical protein
VIETRVLDQADVVLLVGVDAMTKRMHSGSVERPIELVARPGYRRCQPPRHAYRGDLKSVCGPAAIPASRLPRG